MKRIIFVLAAASAMLVFAPTAAVADSARHTYQLHLEEANVAQAPNGDQVAITGEGVFGVHPDTVDAEGEYVHTDPNGNVMGQGTWTATNLLTYQPYGCGVLAFTDPPTPLPPDWCGGRVFMRVLFTPEGTNLELPGTIEVFCIIGPNPPNNHDDPTGEGVLVNVPGIIHFNRIVFGDNLYIQTS
jgi:hypothetical protein